MEDIRAKIIAKAWKDPEFKKRLFKNPKEVLSEFGIKVPEGAKVVVQEEDTKVLHIIVPPTPGQAEPLNEKDLSQRAGNIWESIVASFNGQC